MNRLYVERNAGDKSKVTLKLAHGKPMGSAANQTPRPSIGHGQN